MVPASIPRPAAAAAIGSITLEEHNVFDTSAPPEDKVLYRIANGVHFTTHDSVIRRELLFETGDAYDPALLRETERNLRALPFIRRAETLAVLNSSGTVDVTVRTYDAWSLEFVAGFKRAGGVVNAKAGLAEHNLLGSGKSVSAVYERNDSVNSETFAWKDPQFLNQRHLEYSMAAASGRDSRNYSISLTRPFYASIARSSLGFAGNYTENNITTYSGQTVTGSARKHLGEAGVNYGVALATSTQRTRHLKTGLLFHRADFQSIAGTAPAFVPKPEQALFLQLGVDWAELDFVKERHIQKFSHDEDLNVGFGAFPSLAWAPPGLHALRSSESQVLPSLTLRKGFAFTDQLVFLHGAYATSYVNGSNGNRIISLDALYFLRGLPRQTLAFHAAADHGSRLDPNAPLTLGESNGLRGYGLSQFKGDRRILFNVEDRIFLIDDAWRLVDIGAVAFFDSGYVWPQGAVRRLGDLKNSVGIGLRLAPSRSGNNEPLRIDLARALNANGSNSRWSLSILAGHAFSVFSD